MVTDRRDILERVARGELTPEEADELLGRLEDEAPRPHQDVERIVVRVGVGAVEVVGDPSVRGAEVDGPHTAELEDGALVIRGELERGARRGAFTVHVGRRRLRHGIGLLSRLVVRMRPDLPLDVSLDAGSLSISGLAGPVRARLAAGPLTIEDFAGPLDVAVNAGAIRATGTITGGESRLRSDAGAIRVELDPSSSVEVVAGAALGRVQLPDEDEDGEARTERRGRVTIGGGAGRLRVQTAMGSVHVSVR